ncbi:MAG: polysaccharide deacetylase family protein [Gemmatimonadales bacterium]|nr:polysaccharide deacetylase family protein [Gemmatimonadales bacterium]
MTWPIASLSLDLDNLWTYQRTHGDPGWTERRSYLPALMPSLMGLLDDLNCRITFFVVGADAAIPENVPWLRMITASGHEVGNHSFEHECWLHRHTREQIAGDVQAAEDAIAAATGARPQGFRGPGFSWSPVVLEVLAERGYLYDASTLPTYLAPLARAYFLATARLTPEERRQRRDLFGSFRDGMRPVGAYRWQLASGRTLLEIPVTTIPVVKTPFHMSYLIYLSRFSRSLMVSYLRAALVLCRRSGVTPSFLLHPLDMLGAADAPELKFFPGMELAGEVKRELVREVIGILAEQFTIVPMTAHAAQALSHDRLAVVESRPRPVEAPG